MTKDELHRRAHDLAHERITASNRVAAQAHELLAALKASHGYLQNALIDLQTGTKRETIATLRGGIAVVDAAIAKAEGRS